MVNPKEKAGHIENKVKEIHRAICSPIGIPTISELVKEKSKNILLLVDENNRSTPKKKILTILLDELNKEGVNDNKITVLIALGTHYPMKDEESRERFEKEVVNCICFINHDWQNLKNLVKIKSREVPYLAYINHS